jgi:dCMP deaminase
MPSDSYYMGVAEAVAAGSKDQSTQLGAVIVGKGGEIRATGYNSFPRGVNDFVSARQKRPLKYKWFCHAEANAIANAARCGVAVDGGSLYCRWLPCPSCAMLIIGAGIREIVVSDFKVPERWQGDMIIAVTMLSEAGVVMRVVEGSPRPLCVIVGVLCAS